MHYLTAFIKFWYDFIVGDDWTIAAVVAVTLVAILVAGRSSLWWALPLVVIVSLGASLARATRA